MPAADKVDRAAQQLAALLTEKNSLILGTMDEQGAPDAGLTPFLWLDGVFYVLLSELARHTQQLQRQPRVSVLIHAGDDSTPNPFTDQRASYQAVAAKVIEPEQRERVLTAMTVKLGKTLDLLRGLADFSLYQLRPVRGRLVVGFGAAYDIDPDNGSLHHLDETAVAKPDQP